jgi:Holliday junction DNA helicase RuvB
LLKSLGISGPKDASRVVELPPFTLIGASTLSGLVSAPLRSRFVQTLDLEPYTQDELRRIVLNAAGKLGLKIQRKAADEIARRSRSTARIAIGHLTWVAEYCSGMGRPASPANVAKAFALKQVDEHGLTPLDRRYLSLLASAKEPVGVSSLAASLGESVETIQESIEPYLLQAGFIRRASRGRTLEPKAIEHMLAVEAA